MPEATPFELGYRMPAEWEMHEGTWISWPTNRESFPDDIMGEVEKTYVQIAKALSESETANILVKDASEEERVRSLLASNSVDVNGIAFHRIPTVDVWFRDYGPIFIARQDGEKRRVALTHWKFNAWGGKYEELMRDSRIPDEMPLRGFEHFDIGIVLEGGSIDVNGLGTLLTTEQCLLNRNRNPRLGREALDRYLREYLGATHVIWLGHGVEGDDTDGHVDDIARFVSRDTVLCAYEEDESDGNYAALKGNYDALCNARDQDGKRLKIVKLPMPKPVDYHGQRLPASYTNFYIANKSVLVPTFQDRNDEKAIQIIKGAFPDRKVVGINCRQLVAGFGAIHCVTQQQPL